MVVETTYLVFKSSVLCFKSGKHHGFMMTKSVVSELQYLCRSPPIGPTSQFFKNTLKYKCINLIFVIGKKL